MTIYVNKKNGKIDSLQVYGPELEPLLNLMQLLWNKSDLTCANETHISGIEALQTIMRDFI